MAMILMRNIVGIFYVRYKLAKPLKTVIRKQVILYGLIIFPNLVTFLDESNSPDAKSDAIPEPLSSSRPE